MSEKTKLIIAIVFFEALLLNFTTTFERPSGCFQSQFEAKETDRNYLQAGNVSALLNFEGKLAHQLKMDSLNKTNGHNDKHYDAGTYNVNYRNNYKRVAPDDKRQYFYESPEQMREITPYEHLVAERKKKSSFMSFLKFW